MTVLAHGLVTLVDDVGLLAMGEGGAEEVSPVSAGRCLRRGNSMRDGEWTEEASWSSALSSALWRSLHSSGRTEWQ